MLLIEKLLNEEYAKSYLVKEFKKLGNEYSSLNLSDLRITQIKSNIGKKWFHVVARFDSSSFGNNPIFLTAHSEEKRENAFYALKFINNSFKDNNYTAMPRAMFFNKDAKAFFYRGVKGENLLSFIKNSKTDLSIYIKNIAYVTSDIHSLPISKAKNFNPENSKIETIVPGPKKFLSKIQNTFPEFFDEIKEKFDKLNNLEKKYTKTENKKFFIHGDLHPENIIVSQENKISIIDFTDMCFAHWTRDIGNFLQQFSYMSQGKRENHEIKKYQDLFLNEYTKKRKIILDSATMEKINLYKSWTGLRSAIYFLIKFNPEIENAKILLKEINC